MLIHLQLPLWASVLIVIGLMLLLVAILAFVAMRFARKAWPPKPSQAIEEGELTVQTLKSHV